MPNFLYGLSVYGASSSDLNNVQHFLYKCYKCRYILRKLNIRELLERSDCRTRKGIENKFSPCEDFTRKKFHQLRTKKTMLLSSHKWQQSASNRSVWMDLSLATILIPWCKRSVALIYAYTPVRTCRTEILRKNYIPFISWKSLFSSLNRNDWYIFRTILVSLC